MHGPLQQLRHGPAHISRKNSFIATENYSASLNDIEIFNFPLVSSNEICDSLSAISVHVPLVGCYIGGKLAILVLPSKWSEFCPFPSMPL